MQSVKTYDIQDGLIAGKDKIDYIYMQQKKFS